MAAVVRSFAADPLSVSDARQAVVDALGECPEALVADAALLTSELVSNAVLHARTPFELSISVEHPARTRERVRIEVRDHSHHPPVLREPEAGAIGGRGLLLVHSLAVRWGHERTEDGKAVWFELDA